MFFQRLVHLLISSLMGLARLKVPWQDCIKQFLEKTISTAIFVFITLGFVGALGIYQTATQMARLIPDYSVLGAAFIQMLAREMGPVMLGLMLAIKVGTGLSAEVASMQVTQQLDAMRLCGANPYHKVMAPRLFGSFIAALPLYVVGMVAAMAAGAMVALWGFDVSLPTFFDTRFIRQADVNQGLVKTAVFALVVPAVSMTCGMGARKDSESVGDATTRAVVFSSFSVIFFDLVLGAAMELL